MPRAPPQRTAVPMVMQPLVSLLMSVMTLPVIAALSGQGVRSFQNA